MTAHTVGQRRQFFEIAMTKGRSMDVQQRRAATWHWYQMRAPPGRSIELKSASPE